MTHLPQRKNTRLVDFDYRSPGPYVITVCTQHREHRFGVVNAQGILRLNAAGEMVNDIWSLIPDQYPGTTTDASIVMPNHVHGILTLGMESVETNPDLADVIGWFKTVTTNHYIRGVKGLGWPRYDQRLWQRDYYEHIVRNDAEMDRCREYIANNPANWATDRYA